MKIRYIILILGFIVGIAIFAYFVSAITTLCYQESSNESTSCGGLDTGTYSYNDFWSSPENTTDGDWDTYGISDVSLGGTTYLFINYTKPNGALSTSQWEVKDELSRTNLTILSSCWDYNVDSLSFRVSSINKAPDNVVWSCLNETGWQELRDSGEGTANVYEEAMNWEITTGITYTTQTPVLTLNKESKISLNKGSKIIFKQ